ncbi:hypothetical protein [Streptomyces sp. NPDC018031]
MDPVRPAATCHRYAAGEAVEVYPRNGHEGSGRVPERLRPAVVRDRTG